MNTRTTWTDVERAARRLAELARDAGYPVPDIEGATLMVERGSVTGAHAAVMQWGTSSQRDNATPVPGGAALARSARDSYEMVTQRNAMLADLAYQTRR